MATGETKLREILNMCNFNKIKGISLKNRQNRKIALYIVTLLLIGVFIGAGVTYAQTSLSRVYISGGPYPSADTYTIFQESGVCYAKNANGQITQTSTSASTIINNALASGGSIYLTKNTYVLTATLVIPSNTQINSNGATLYGASLGATPAIYVNTVENVTITNLNFQSIPNIGIYIEDSNNVEITQNKFSYCGWAIATNADAGETLNNIQISNNIITHVTYHGIQIAGRQSAASGEADVTITNNFITYAGDDTFAYSTGIDVENWACASGKVYVNIADNIIKYSGEDGVHAEKINGTLIVDGNTLIENGQDSSLTYGSGVLVADVADAIVSNNVMRENGKYGFMLYQSQAYLNSLTVSGNTINSNVDRGLYLNFITALNGSYPTINIVGNTVTDNGQDGLDVLAAGSLGNVTWIFTVSGNTFANNLAAITTDVYQGEIKFYCSGSGTTYLQAYILNNEVYCTNDHTYPVIIAYAHDYTVQANSVPLLQRGVNIANSNGVSQYNDGF